MHLSVSIVQQSEIVNWIQLIREDVYHLRFRTHTHSILSSVFGLNPSFPDFHGQNHGPPFKTTDRESGRGVDSEIFKLSQVTTDKNGP